MASQYSIDINGNKVTVQTFNVTQGAGAKGEVLKIRLPQGAKVEIADTTGKFAATPKGFKSKKVGNDLHLAFQGSDMAKPDVVIEGFYGKNGERAELIAKGAKGEYLAYNVPATETMGTTTPTLGKTAVSPWGNLAGPVEPVIAAERIAPATDPGAVATATGLPPAGSTSKLGALGWVGGGLALAAAAAGGGGGGGEKLNGAGPIKNLSSTGDTPEGQPLTFTVELNATVTTAIGFKIQVTGVDAARLTYSGAHYSNGYVIPDQGVSKFSVSLPSSDDGVYKGNTPVSLRIYDDSSSPFSVEATGVIVDNDTPTIAEVAPATAVEGHPIEYLVELKNPSATSTQVALTLTGGSASEGTDYTPAMQVSLNGGDSWSNVSSGTVSVPAGTTSFLVRVATSRDSVAEPNETIVLTAKSEFDAAATSATGTIVDDNGQPKFSISSNVPINEGETATFTVTLSVASSSTSTVHYSTSDGTATSPGDYTATSGTLTFAPGETTKVINVATKTDNVYESSPTESFRVNLDSATGNGVSIATPSGTASISDLDQPPTIASISAAAATEGSAIVHTVSISGSSTNATTFALSFTDGTATGADYTSALSNSAFNNGVTIQGGVISVPAGVTTFTVTVPTTQDSVAEADETYTLTIGGAHNTGTIRNDDAGPTVTSVANGSALEGNAPTGNTISHTVTVTGSSATATNIPFTLGGGTATSGVDYSTTITASNGVTVSGSNLVLPANFTSGTFTVNVTTVGDSTVEPDETYELTIGGTVKGTGTIQNDDTVPAPAVASVSNGSALEGATSASNPITHTVAVTGSSSTTTLLPFTLGGGTATSGVDYSTTITASNGVTVSGSNLVLPANFSAGTFTVTVNTIGDTAVESDETYDLTIGGGTIKGTGTIQNDDTVPAPSIVSVGNGSAAEGNTLSGNPITHTVTVTGSSTTATNIPFSLSGGSATSGEDYSPTITASSGVTVSGSNLVLPANFSAGTFTVTVNTIGDTTVELDETYTLTVGGAPGTGTITNDDSAPVLPTVSLSQVTLDPVAENVNTVSYQVTLSAASAQSVSVTYATADGTATAISGDYTAATNTVTIPAGQTTATFTVAVVNDLVDEPAPDETFTVALSAPTNATLGTVSSLTTHIVDDDPAIVAPPPVVATQDTYTLSATSTSTITDFQTGVGGDLIDVTAYLAAFAAPATGTTGNGVLTAQGAFVGTPPSASTLSALLAATTVADGSHHVVLVKDTTDATKAYVYFTEESATDSNTSIDAAELTPVASIAFAPGSTFDDLVLHNIHPTL